MEESVPCSVIPISWPFLRHLESHFQYQPSLACTTAAHWFISTWRSLFVLPTRSLTVVTSMCSMNKLPAVHGARCTVHRFVFGAQCNS